VRRAFEIDWGRVVEKGRFKRLILKAAKGDEEELGQVMLVVKKYYSLLSDAFEYYGSCEWWHPQQHVPRCFLALARP